MLNILADENFSLDAVEALRDAGYDVTWIRSISPGINDETVLALAEEERRILVTFDKDFGELAFKYGVSASCGIVLFRVSASSSQDVVDKVISALTSRSDWQGHFSVVDDRRIRMRKL